MIIKVVLTLRVVNMVNFRDHCMYTGHIDFFPEIYHWCHSNSSWPSLIRPLYLPRKCGHIREVAFGERVKVCGYIRRWSVSRVTTKRGTNVQCLLIFKYHFREVTNTWIPCTINTTYNTWTNLHGALQCLLDIKSFPHDCWIQLFLKCQKIHVCLRLWHQVPHL